MSYPRILVLRQSDVSDHTSAVNVPDDLPQFLENFNADVLREGVEP